MDRDPWALTWINPHRHLAGEDRRARPCRGSRLQALPDRRRGCACDPRFPFGRRSPAPGTLATPREADAVTSHGHNRRHDFDLHARLKFPDGVHALRKARGDERGPWVTSAFRKLLSGGGRRRQRGFGSAHGVPHQGVDSPSRAAEEPVISGLSKASAANRCCRRAFSPRARRGRPGPDACRHNRRRQ